MALAMTKTAARAATTGLAAGVATVAGQIVYVGRLDLPEHPDLDASGRVGPTGIPALDVVVLGDSACTGPGLHRPDDIWVRQLLARFDDRAFAVESFAVGGARTTDVIAGQVPAAVDRHHDIAIVSAGLNDALHGRSLVGLEARLGHIVDELLERADVVVFMGVGDVGSAPRLPFPLSATATAVARRADRAQRRVGRERERVFKSPMWETTTAGFRTRDDVWSTDHYHPNAAGHALWADAVQPALAAALEHLDEIERRAG